MTACISVFSDVDLSESYASAPAWAPLWKRYWEALGPVGSIREIPLTAIVATQPDVDSERVSQYINGEVPPRRRLPLVALLNDHYYVVDGHHRLAAAILSGHGSITCEVLNLSTKTA